MRTEQDFWDLIDATGACWLWTGAGPRTQGGYAHLRWACLPERYVHRAAWSLLVGPIPDGLQIDHLCRVRTCCNPDHMQLVTASENMARKPTLQHCKRGHGPLTDANSISNGATRLCRECRREYRRRKSRTP